jgi:hypothetical protein
MKALRKEHKHDATPQNESWEWLDASLMWHILPHKKKPHIPKRLGFMTSFMGDHRSERCYNPSHMWRNKAA